MKTQINTLLVLFLVFVSVGLTACGGGDTPPPTDPGTQPPIGTNPIGPTLIIGAFVDSPVEGLRYSTAATCSSTSPLTNAQGEFSYHAGERLTFCIGDVLIGPMLAAPIINPFVVFGTTDINDRRVINLARLLQTLDTDNNFDNGITIDPTAHTAASGRPVNFDVPVADFETNANVLFIVNNSNSGDTVLVSQADAIAHLKTVLQYVYYTDSPTAASVAGTLTTINPLAPAIISNSNTALVANTVGTDTIQRVTQVYNTNYDSTTNNYEYIRLHAVVFVDPATGSLFKKSATVTDPAPAPVQISNVTGITDGPGDGGVDAAATDICELATIEETANVDTSIIYYGLAGSDTTCNTLDDSYAWLRLNTDTMTAPTAITGLTLVGRPIINNLTGAIDGYVSRNSSGQVVKLDVNIANPVVATDSGNYAYMDIIVDSMANGQMLLQLNNELHAYDPVTNTVGAVLATLSQADTFDYVYDATGLYFVDNATGGSNTIRRISLSTPAAAETVITEPAGNINAINMQLTNNRIVYTVPGTGTRSVDRTATGATTSTALVNETPGVGIGNTFLSYILTGNNNKIYINEWLITAAPTQWTVRAHVVNDDGTGLVTRNDATWIGAFFGYSINAFRNTADVQQVLLLQRSAAGAVFDANAVLTTYIGETAASAGIPVGSLPNDINMMEITVGLGPRANAVTTVTTTTGDTDVVYFDSLIPGSLTRLTTDATTEQLLNVD